MVHSYRLQNFIKICYSKHKFIRYFCRQHTSTTAFHILYLFVTLRYLCYCLLKRFGFSIGCGRISTSIWQHQRYGDGTYHLPESCVLHIPGAQRVTSNERPCRSSAVRCWLPTAAARVRVRAACGVCGGQSGTGAGFLRVLRFPLPLHQFLHYHNHPGLTQ
jgi:hypothetical protein